MPIYPGRRKGTHRVTLWIRGKGQKEWLVEGTRREARDFETLRRAEFCGPSRAGSRAVPTLSAFIRNAYEPHARAHLRSSTWKRSRVTLLTNLRDALGDRKLDAICGPAVEAYVRGRLEAGKERSTINSELQVLKTVLRFARDDMGVLVGDIRIKRLKEDKRRVHVWSGEDVAALYATVRTMHPTLLPLTEILLNTGMRKGEALAAEWSWVDWRARLLRIPVTEHWRPKDGESRDVPIDGLMPLLRRLPRTGKHVILSSLGTGYACFPDKHFHECVVAAGLKGGPHTCRHTYASHFLQAVPDLGLLAHVLGHSHTRVTELYAHLLPGHMDRARGAVRLAPPGSTHDPEAARVGRAVRQVPR